MNALRFDSLSTNPRAHEARASGYTLIELLIVVVVMGIAGAMVIPSMSRAGVLRIHAAVRSIVADLTFAQSDAAAFQQRRVVYFGQVASWDDAASAWTVAPGNGYTLYAPPAGAANVDLVNDIMFDPFKANEAFTTSFDASKYGGAQIANASFNGTPMVIFDELGGTGLNLTSDAPGVGGSVQVVGPLSTFTISVDAFTGRVTVTKTTP